MSSNHIHRTNNDAVELQPLARGADGHLDGDSSPAKGKGKGPYNEDVSVVPLFAGLYFWLLAIAVLLFVPLFVRRQYREWRRSLRRRRRRLERGRVI